jgi:alpha-1,3/alpha-1,6-mannosyltransferase
VYPCVDTKPKKEAPLEDDSPAWKDTGIILSINRFERKKDVALAIKAYAGLSREKRKGVRLVIAGMSEPLRLEEIMDSCYTVGGYDNRVTENVAYHKELVELAGSLGLSAATTRTIVTALNVPNDVEVLFLLSVPNTLKDMLLRSARLLVYTPPNEHFGIVPLEAMLSGVPVLAANTGGPTETIAEGVTGWLRDPSDVQQWTDVMDRVLTNMSMEELAAMSKAGVDRVKSRFAETQMAERLEGILDEIGNRPRPSTNTVVNLCLLGIVGAISVLVSKALMKAA